MSRCSFDDAAQEFFAPFCTLHDFPRRFHLLCMLRSIRGVFVLWILVSHGLFCLCCGIPKPLGNIKLSSKLKDNNKKCFRFRWGKQESQHNEGILQLQETKNDIESKCFEQYDFNQCINSEESSILCQHIF